MHPEAETLHSRPYTLVARLSTVCMCFVCAKEREREMERERESDWESERESERNGERDGGRENEIAGRGER